MAFVATGPGIAELLERVAKLLALDVGDTRFEVALHDGRIRYVYTHRRYEREELAERFDQAEDSS